MDKNIFIVGADPFNMKKIRAVDIGVDYKTHELLSFD